ncbi:MAG: cyclopropane-fatty-acyl-phospholipid synthase family protein [Pigmentiphaga sp.]
MKPVQPLSRRLHRWLTVALGAAAFSAAGLALASEPATKPLDVPYVPTPQTVVDRMLEMANVDAGDYVIDLGSGDGRIPVTAASRYGARALGVDLNPERIAEANENAVQAGVTDKVEFRQQDLFKTEFRDATVVTMYLLPNVNLKLRPRLLDELRPGTFIVSHAFDMQDWEPDQRETVEGRSVMLWIIPAKVGGVWQVAGSDPFVLELEQNFQRLEGAAIRGDERIELTDGRVRGDQITFTIDGNTYQGRIGNEAISGDDGTWHALRG